VHPDDLEKLQSTRAQSVKEAGYFQCTYRIVLKAQKIRNVTQQFESVANEAGVITRVYGTVQDITERMEVEEKLKALNNSLDKRNLELLEKNEELSAFAFIASHDLKEPLRKIHTFSDWINKNEADKLSEKGRSSFQRLQAAVKRMDILIEDILSLSRLNSAVEPFSIVDPNIIFKEIIEEAGQVISEKNASIIVGPLPKINGHSSQLFYLFNNLLMNALKFQKKEEPPVINVSGITVNGKDNGLPEGMWVKISVADNGIGFANEYAKKIFQIFQRLHSQHEFPGTGIGLSICKKVMENHNGFIEAESILGEGSVFNCYFPVQ